MKQIININLIDFNQGQLNGLKANPRYINEKKYKQLVKSIKECPEMLEYRGLLVYPYDNGRYIAIGGNMRLRAMSELNIKECHCEVLDSKIKVEQLNEILIKDNLGYGSWDFDLIANEWETNLLSDWGFDLPIKDEVIIEEPVQECKLIIKGNELDALQAELIERGFECKLK